MTAVEVCLICDIAECRHIRERKAKMTHPTDEELDAPRYLIRKHGSYYRPNSQGYTGSAILAGRYTLAEAENITHPNGHDGPRDGMTYIHENDLRDDDWKAYAALRAQRAEAWAAVKLTAEISEKAFARADRAEAALAAQIEADAWQPIDTAPTDYTHVIGIDAKGCVARTWFFAPSSLTRQWLRVGLPGKAVWHPTHWKPLRETTAQPHDRTALDRMLRAEREKALLEVADAFMDGSAPRMTILAMIEQEGA